MRLNQITVTMPDLDAGWNFYLALGLGPVVDARPRYARFLCTDGGTTLSLHQGKQGGGGTTIYFECDDLNERVAALRLTGFTVTNGIQEQPWLWREAELFDPGGNRVLLYHAGENRTDPPWRVARVPAVAE
jgi:predicted enzyme related to lactoylglutathione lyase